MTDVLDFEDENVPPRFVSDPTSPIGTIVEIDLTDPTRGDMIAINVFVEDENIGQPYETRMRTVTLGADSRQAESQWINGPAGIIPQLPELASVSIRQANIPLPASEVRNPGQCLRYDLLVSSGFVPGPGADQQVPVQEGDIARATWYLWLVDADLEASVIDPTTCPRKDISALGDR